MLGREGLGTRIGWKEEVRGGGRGGGGGGGGGDKYNQCVVLCLQIIMLLFLRQQNVTMQVQASQATCYW